jgi:small subunit ribosomal protein S7
MARRRQAVQRKVLPDPRFKSEVIAKFINTVMVSGKKSIAEAIVYEAIGKAAEKIKKNNPVTEAGTSAPTPVDIFMKVLENVRPLVEVRSRRVGGATYQVPVEVRHNRSMALAMAWIITAARSRGKGIKNNLYLEIIDAYDNKGAAVSKRENTHKMAKANQAFAHFRWS